MSVLSEFDIYRELGREILIYPFSIDKMKGGCLRLTASEHIYKPYSAEKVNIKEEFLKDANGEEIKDEKGNSKKKRYFVIEQNDTVAVWTNESIFLGGGFCASIHSRVRLVSQGLGHIGTKVDPSWCGILAIALHNTSGRDIKVEAGDTIAYLRFHQFQSSSLYSLPRHENTGKLYDIFGNLENSSNLADLSKWLYEDQEAKWRNGKEKDL